MASLIEGAIRSILIDTAAVGDIVGSRVYWQKTPQQVTAPAVIFHAVSDPHEPMYMTLDGSKTKAGQRLFEFTCMSEESMQGLNLVQQVMNTLRWAQGATYGFTIETVIIQDVRKQYNPETDMYLNFVDAVVEYFEA